MSLDDTEKVDNGVMDRGKVHVLSTSYPRPPYYPFTQGILLSKSVLLYLLSRMRVKVRVWNLNLLRKSSTKRFPPGLVEGKVKVKEK